MNVSKSTKKMEKQKIHMFPLLPASEQEKMQAEVTSEKSQDGVNSGSGELLLYSSPGQQTCVSSAFAALA